MHMPSNGRKHPRLHSFGYVLVGVAGSLATIIFQSLAQSPPATARPSFDVASIKPSATTIGGRQGPPGGTLRYMPGKVIGNVTARRIITEAYHLTDYQVFGGPAWIDNDRFDIEAKAATADDETQLREMLQTLLADRFKLVLRRETKEMPVYALTVGKKGSKLSEASKESPGFQTIPVKAGAGDQGGYRILDRGTMQHFADTLSRVPSVDRLVLDRTGLEGTYVLNLLWEADESITTAVQDQLGLKLEPQRATADVVYVDHVEKPSPN